MKKVQYQIIINAPAGKVFDCMLGISKKQTYEQWTALFNPTSSYEGSWTKGNKMLFIGIDDKGEKGGMVSEIVEIIPNHFVSIRHFGLLKGEKEITTGSDVEKWANGFENYTYEESNGTTLVTVDLDTTDEFLDFVNQTYPKALDKLKEICEK